MARVQEIESLVCDRGDTVYHVGAYPAHKGLEHGDQKVKEIGQHSPQGPGDVWFYDVIFEDGSAVRVFNMDKVFIGKPKQILDVPAKPKIIFN